MSRPKLPAPPAPPLFDPCGIVDREAQRIAADPNAAPELRAAARAHLLGLTVEDAMRLAVVRMSPEQVQRALEALGDGDVEEAEELLVPGLQRPTRERRANALALVVFHEQARDRAAARLAALDEELAAEVGRPTPAIALDFAEGGDEGEHDASAEPDVIVTEPIAAPRTPDEWVSYAKQILEKRRVAEAERAAQAQRELDERRAAAQRQVDREERQAERDRRRGY